MNFIDRYKRDMEYIEKLRGELDKNIETRKAYEKEIEPLTREIDEIGRKYRIDSIDNEILRISKDINDSKHSRYIFFLECLYEIRERCYRENLNFDVVSFLIYKKIDLYDGFERYPLNDGAYVENNIVYIYEENNNNHFEILEFDRSYSVEELAELLVEIEMAINCEKLLKIIESYKNDKLILDKIPNILSELGVEYISKNFYTGSVFIENHDGIIIAYSANAIYSLLTFSKDVNLVDAIYEFKEKIKNIEDEIKNDEEYKEYLRLKNKFE